MGGILIQAIKFYLSRVLGTQKSWVTLKKEFDEVIG